MIKKRFLMVAALGIAGLVFGAGAVGPRQPVGEIVNPSMETLNADGRPANWTLEPAARPNAPPGGQLVTGTAQAGEHSLMISTPNASWQNKTLVRPYATYRFSGWIKTQDVPAAGNRAAMFDLRGVKVTSPAKRFNGTTDWTAVEITFETEGQDSLIIAATMTGPRGGRGSRARDTAPVVAPGQAWFDNVRLELLSARTLKPAITIDVSKTREAMPDFIYGQFIEHLGRCIYGGIWAELIEDRKFYSAVGETRRDKVFVPSPWKAVGGADAVTMVKENAFVGEHTPQVELGTGGSTRGIAQTGLGLIAGRGYSGYVILAGDASAAPIEVSLSWGSTAGERRSVKIDKITGEFE